MTTKTTNLNLIEIKDCEAIKDLRWVLLAKTKKTDVNHPWMDYIQVKDGVVVATDAHRLHAFETNIVPDGGYEVKTNRRNLMVLKPADAEVPPARLFDHVVVERGHREVVLDLYPWSPDNDAVVVWEMVKGLGTQTHGYNYKYLSDAVRCHKGYNTKLFENNNSLMIKTPRCTAKIMNMKL